MSTVTIPLGARFEYALAVACVEIIHAEIINRHLRRAGYTHAEFYAYSAGKTDLAEVCALFRSLPDTGWGCRRRELRGLVRYLLSEKMKESHTARRWQDYIRLAAATRGAICPATNDDPAWESFILREKAAA